LHAPLNANQKEPVRFVAGLPMRVPERLLFSDMARAAGVGGVATWEQIWA
jgi:hypothetical protein